MPYELGYLLAQLGFAHAHAVGHDAVEDDIRVARSAHEAQIVKGQTCSYFVQMLMQAFVPALYATLGVFIPLIVVNCIILGRAEAFASKNNAFDSALDGLGIGLGFTLSLTVIGTIRELLGSGAVFGYSLGTADYMPLVFVLAPGGFLVLGYLMVVFNKLAKK